MPRSKKPGPKLIDNWSFEFGDRITITKEMAYAFCYTKADRAKLRAHRPVVLFKISPKDMLIVFRLGNVYKLRRDDA